VSEKDDQEFWRIFDEEARRDRIARGEPTYRELLRFARDEMDSVAAPDGTLLHASHQPQSDADAAGNPENGRYCLRCCVLVSSNGAAVTRRGAGECAGKRTMALGTDDQLRWVAVPEVGC
jgi:hypothetical protein